MSIDRILHPFAVFLFVAILAPACVFVDDEPEATLLVVNRSDFAIIEIYLTEVNNPDWGPNLLRGTALFPGDSFEIFDIGCDFYDALLIDEDGIDCKLAAVDLCFEDATWIIRNNTCTVFDARQKQSI